MKYRKRLYRKSIRIILIAFLLCLVSVILSFIFLIQTRTSETIDGKLVYTYNDAFLFWNMFSFILMGINILLLVILLVVRFVKESKSPAWKIDQVSFDEDDKDGAFLLATKKEKIDYLSMLYLNLYTSRPMLISSLVVMFLAGMGLLALSFFPFEALYFYTFLIFLFLGLLVGLSIVFLLPIYRIHSEKSKEASFYEDRIIYTKENEEEEVLYYSQFLQMLESKTFFFLFYARGASSYFALPKKELTPEQIALFQARLSQIRRNQHQ